MKRLKQKLLFSALVSCFAAYPAISVVADDSRKRLFQTAPEPDYTQDDIEAEITFGRELAGKILGKYPALKDDKVNKYVNKVGQNLAIHCSRTELTYYFVVLDTPIINAFAAPGGYIFVTKGAIEQMQDESELASVIGHEFGHIEKRHYVKAVGLRSTKGGAESGLTAALSGGGAAAAKAMNQAVSQSMEVLFEKGLKSHKEEFEADEHSVWLLANTGYDPNALQRFFKRISDIHNEKTKTLSKTHPPLADRIAKLEQINTENQLDQLNYATLQERFNENK